ncbi:hypothetical protein M23134_01163 [Microscilla marina ATCC 23134]|uniref:Uncharacterized protein n=1 Tax=Microscilla marina ATCC 23134 TaxID=313606 RepID=A1ZFR5_MICM2|nr:hypothetical protein M23134_01163 [Microscilla marina ATCC 23134]
MLKAQSRCIGQVLFLAFGHFSVVRLNDFKIPYRFEKEDFMI